MVHAGCHLQDQHETVFIFSWSPVAISAAELSEIEITCPAKQVEAG